MLPGVVSLGFAILALLVGVPSTLGMRLGVIGLLRQGAMERKTRSWHEVWFVCLWGALGAPIVAGLVRDALMEAQVCRSSRVRIGGCVEETPGSTPNHVRCGGRRRLNAGARGRSRLVEVQLFGLQGRLA